jgi:hypothetical protein
MIDGVLAELPDSATTGRSASRDTGRWSGRITPEPDR